MPRLPKLVMPVAGVVLALLAVASVSPAASAGPRAAAAVAVPVLAPATVSQDQLPTTQINGIAWAQAVVGNKVYVVGRFSAARPAGAAVGTNEVARGNILAYDIRTGVLDTSFVHTLDVQGQSIAVSPDKSVIYVGGQFDRVDGQVRQRIAAFSTATGRLLPFAPRFSSAVQAIAVTNDTVYAGGSFGMVNDVTRNRVAAVDTAGNLRPWAPVPNNVVSALVVSPDGSKVFVGGKFTSVNGSPDFGLAAVHPTTGAVIPTQASQRIIAANNTSSAGIFSLRTDGHLIYASGFNAYASPYPQFEGTTGIDQSGNVLWVNDCWGDSYDATPINGALYVASHAHNCAGAQWFPELGSTHYYGLAYGLAASQAYNVVDARGWDYSAFHTSQIYSWTPAFSPGAVTGQSVWAFAGNADYVAAAGEFPRVNQVAQQGLVRFAVHAKAPNAWGPSGIGTLRASVTGARGSQHVDVTVTGRAYDPDDSTMVYTLVRNGDPTRPVAAQVVPTPGFWQKGTGSVTLTDANPLPGTSSTYQVVATDAGGRRAGSATITVTVDAVTSRSTVDLALDRAATQSSTFGGSAAMAASAGNDGSTSTFNHTGADPWSWWQVDLGSSRALSAVAVTNRPDCCQGRLADYWIFVSGSPFDTSLSPAQQATRPGVVALHQTVAPAPTARTFLPAGTSGRYVMVQLGTPNQYLHAAAIQALGPRS